MNTDAETVSIVIATYNSANYLKLTLDSVLAQTYTDYRIYIVDDGSTDNTAEVVRPYLESGRCEYHKQANKGQASAKNKGAKLAKGSLLAFLDSDDLWRNDKLQIQVPLFDNPDIGVTYSRCAFIDEAGLTYEKAGFKQPIYTGTVLDHLFLTNFLPFSSTMITNRLFSALGGFDENLGMGIDWDLWLRASLITKFNATPEKTLFYRVWHGQMSSNVVGRYRGAFRIMDKFLKANPDVLPKNDISKAYSITFANRAYHIYFSEKRLVAAFKDIVQSIKQNPLSMHPWKILVRICINTPRQD